MIKREQVPKAALPQEEVEVPSLGGSVLVRGLPLSYILSMAYSTSDLSLETNVLEILEMCVVLEDGKPVYSKEEWDLFSSGRKEELMTLLETVKKLTGLSKEENEKNSESQP